MPGTVLGAGWDREVTQAWGPKAREVGGSQIGQRWSCQPG